jgi:predicted AlkP superfamily phosphohydrolase/phosphomutase
MISRLGWALIQRAATSCALAIALVSPGLAASAAADGGRVIVLGFDGADEKTAQELMDRGELPNLARLRAEGTFAPLGTTTPAESPVSWAALNSGQNPAKTGISGFVMRELGGGGPSPALGHQEHGARRTDSFELNLLFRWLVSGEPALVAAWTGGALAVVFALVFVLLLRMRARMALVLAALLGIAGACGGYVASRAIPREIVDVVGNPTKTAGFWEDAARAGVQSVVLDAAMAWDRPSVPDLKLLAGLGVPDVRGSYGDWFLYTTDNSTHSESPKAALPAPDGTGTSTAGRVFHVEERDGKIESTLFGPRNLWSIDLLKRELKKIDADLARATPGSNEALRLADRKREIKDVELAEFEGKHDSDIGRVGVPLKVVKRTDGGNALVSLGGQEQELAPGEWSKWYHVRFKFNALVQMHAVTRVKILSMKDPFSLYVDFLQMDPSNPPYWQPISTPSSFAGELARAIGEPYETVGWACMTMPLKDREIDPVTFLQDIEFTQGWREKILMAALGKSDWRLFMNVESTPDRVQHMMYQFYDPTHPMYDAEKAREKTTYFGREIELKDAIPATYHEMDRLVGEVMTKHLRPGDTLLICADHGFESFRRGVNLNNWLAEHGFLKVRENMSRRMEADILQFVDWEHTRAYALGLGMIFLNYQDTHPQGIVSAADGPALIAEIKKALLETVDPQTNERAVRSVSVMSEVHSGPYLEREADLMPGFAAGYRVSWSTTLGNLKVVKGEGGVGYVAGPTFEDNTSNWSGDHVSVSEDLVRGVFFSNRKVEIPAGGVDLLHIAPTALSLLGVQIPPAYDRPPLRFTD